LGLDFPKRKHELTTENLWCITLHIKGTFQKKKEKEKKVPLKYQALSQIMSKKMANAKPSKHYEGK
jgi:hypothetical protein